jgi:hypothetical protein
MVYAEMAIVIQHYDQKRGWEETCPGWYEHEISIGSSSMSETYEEVLEWLYNRVDNCERHARWRITRGLIQVKFRYERDIILCRLSF